MPSNQFILAYYSKKPLTRDSIHTRAEMLAEYTSSLHRKPSIVQGMSVGLHTGILAWQPSDESVGWPQFKSNDDEAVAWIGIPEHDAMSSTKPDALALAREATLVDGDPDALGAPYACVYRAGDSLRIVNDSLGLARLYEFEFDDLSVWATRPGLAHIFAGKPLERNEDAWSGMATLGWNVGGHTHIGAGRQMPGSIRIVASSERGVRREDRYSEWIHRTPDASSSWQDASQGMIRTMSLGGYFPRSPIADLSGGKDSRLLAAAALTSGVTETVRTVRSDHGEVETAEKLVSAYPGKINHLVTEVSAPKDPAEKTDLEDHLLKTMRGSEGALVPFTALQGPTFTGYPPLVIARFNGHGGEALHGGEYYKGIWAERLAGSGTSGAVARMEKMVAVARATSQEGRERTMETIKNRFAIGSAMGIDTACGLLNYFYSAERMPFWASSSPNRSVITPYYSSGLLKQIGRTFIQKNEFENFYSEILKSLIPAWAEIPFYRPAGVKRRTSKFFWEFYHWNEIKDFVLERADGSSNFDAEGMLNLVHEVESGAGSKNIEATFSRFIWEMSVNSVIDDINNRAFSVRRRLEHAERDPAH